jgi:ABC-2 type transport system permease protein
MLGVLLKKDLLRLLRNPWGWILNLCLPLAISALIALAFGGGKQGPSVARIKVAVVDEDESVIGTVLKGGLSQGEAVKHVEPIVATNRAEALQLIREDRVSAALIIPAHFTKDFVLGRSGLALEVIKNPSQRIYPAIIEQLAGTVVSILNAAGRNFHSELASVEAMLTNKVDLLDISAALTRVGKRVEAAREYLNPPLVTCTKETIRSEPAKQENAGPGVFAFVLPGMASAFLLFIADHSMRDLNRERRIHTFPRMMTLTTRARTFVAGKVVVAGLSVFFGSVILFAAGDLIFRIGWRHPGLLLIACAAYAVFCAGFTAALVSLVPNERQSERVNNMLLFALAFLGGSYIPANTLPSFMQHYICPLMPNFWFTECLRGLQESGAAISGAFLNVLKLGGAGILLAASAAYFLERRLNAGARG